MLTEEQVRERLAAEYGERGRVAADKLGAWMGGRVPLADTDPVRAHFDEEHLGLLFDAFWQDLPIGTGGKRGRVGYGANRMNPSTLATTVQGHANYLVDRFGSGKAAVVVANDVRVFRDVAGTYAFLGDDHPLVGVGSRSLARLACEIYAGNGIRAYLVAPEDDDAVLTTPELSYLIRELGAQGGANLSASHNPPDDNGIKLYDEHGGQPVAPQDQTLVDTISKVETIERTAFAEGLAAGSIAAVPDHLHGHYLALYAGKIPPSGRARGSVPLVYTPLCGAGATTVGETLSAAGFDVRVPADQGPDGSFAAIPFKAPNPEVPQATVPACEFADTVGARMVLSTDPDADRIGIEVRSTDGPWRHLDGNQIAAVLGYYLLLDPEGPRQKGLVIETIVTTRLLSRFAAEIAAPVVDDLLVGFKYVADVLAALERDGHYRGVHARAEDLVLAAEESHGVLLTSAIRDKDAASASVELGDLYERLDGEGRTLFDYYVAILERFGPYETASRSILMAGAEGVARRDTMMQRLRAEPPKSIGGAEVLDSVDYHDQERFGAFASDTDRLPRDVLALRTKGFLLTIRPSGTEPKLKFYCQLTGGELSPGARGEELLAEARALADSVATIVYNELLAVVDLRLSDAALLLPDVVDLDRKLDFDARVAPALVAGIADGTLASTEAALAWLATETAQMTPGADPLPALRRPVAALLAQDGSGGEVVRGLLDWAGA